MALKEEKKAGTHAAGPIPASYGAWLLPVYLLSLVLLFVGERIVSSDTARYVLSGLGLLGTIATTAVRFSRSGSSTGERGAAERVLALCSLGGLAAVALYFATTEGGKKLLGVATMKPETRARFEGGGMILWIALLLVSVIPLIFGEIALAPMRRAAMIEARRVRAALASGLVLACAAIYGTLFTYTAGELDVKADFSYYRTARPSESTKNVAAASSEPITIRAFFPQLNEVGNEVLGYLREVARNAPNVKLEEYDRLLVPAIAKEAKVTTDGVVVLTRGASREQLNVGTEMKTALSKLKSFDGDFQKALLKVTREARVAYFTVGHGELNESRGDTTAEGRTAKVIKKIFESQNYTVKDLGLVQGLGNDVPADATVVVVLGPSQAFLPEEVTSLKRYGEHGGHLLLALDPDGKAELSPLAEIAGLTWSPTVLANDKAFYRLRHNNSDRTILAVNRFSSHASVSTLSRNAAHLHLVMPRAAGLDKGPDQGLKIDFTVKAMGETFDDKNGNFELDSGEKRQAWNLAAAVSKTVAPPAGYKGKDPPEYRAFVIGDADCISDFAMGNEPNVFFAADVIRWLGGEESFSGAITNNEDVRIEHTKQKDAVWFYATLFGAPFLVLAIGAVVARRSRREEKSTKQEKSS